MKKAIWNLIWDYWALSLNSGCFPTQFSLFLPPPPVHHLQLAVYPSICHLIIYLLACLLTGWLNESLISLLSVSGLGEGGVFFPSFCWCLLSLLSVWPSYWKLMNGLTNWLANWMNGWLVFCLSHDQVFEGKCPFCLSVCLRMNELVNWQPKWMNK